MSTFTHITTEAPLGIEMARREGARLWDGRGTLITVQQGSVWITQDGSSVDICLDAGQSFRVDRDGLTLVAATSPMPARVTFTPFRPRPHAPSRVAAGVARMRASLPAAARRSPASA